MRADESHKATHQAPNTQQIFEGIRKLARIWRKPEPTYHPMCTLQEHVRRATKVMTSYESLKYLSAGDARIVAETLHQVEKVFEIEFPRDPDSMSDWHTSRNVFQLGPPGINTKYYFYGLLDCTAQLGTYVNLQMARPELAQRIRHFIFTTNVMVYRLKAVSCRFLYLSFHADSRETNTQKLEALLSCKPDQREASRQLFDMVIDPRFGSATRRERIGNDIELVLEMLHNFENLGLRHCVNVPVRG